MPVQTENCPQCQEWNLSQKFAPLPHLMVPSGPYILKYLDPPELIFQSYIEIYAWTPSEIIDPPWSTLFDIYGPPWSQQFDPTEVYSP